jgi:hypothetical protein
MGYTLGGMLEKLAELISKGTDYIIFYTAAAVALLLLLRWVTDTLNTNPFGRLTYYLRKPTNDLFYYVRSSQFYLPLKQALRLDPTYLMVLIAVAILLYVAWSIIGYLITLLNGLGSSLNLLADGYVARGIYTLIGVALLTVIFFLMTLMTIVFINWISGRFNRSAYWSMHRISPLLRIFEFGGALAGFSFLILWLVLLFAASAVRAVFFGV